MIATDMRAEFEAWAVNQPWLENDEGRVNLRYLGLHKQYVDMTVELASRAYAAGRNAKREPLSDEQLAKLAYQGYDDYWTENCLGDEKEAWAMSAKRVLSAHGIGADHKEDAA